jgi:hypothetical protein
VIENVCSGLKADKAASQHHVCFVPQADIAPKFEMKEAAYWGGLGTIL